MSNSPSCKDTNFFRTSTPLKTTTSMLALQWGRENQSNEEMGFRETPPIRSRPRKLFSDSDVHQQPQKNTFLAQREAETFEKLPAILPYLARARSRARAPCDVSKCLSRSRMSSCSRYCGGTLYCGIASAALSTLPSPISPFSDSAPVGLKM